MCVYEKKKRKEKRRRISSTRYKERKRQKGKKRNKQLGCCGIVETGKGGKKKKKILWHSWLLFKRGVRSVKAWLKQHFSKINSVFSLFWRENFLVGQGRKHLGPTIYFSSFPSNQTHSKKVLFPIFSPKFSIHPILPPNKHTLSA